MQGILTGPRQKYQKEMKLFNPVPMNCQAGTSREELEQVLTIRVALIQEKLVLIKTVKDNPNKLKLCVIITQQ